MLNLVVCSDTAKTHKNVYFKERGLTQNLRSKLIIEGGA